MVVAHFALVIGRKDAQISDVQLGSKREDDALGNVGRIGQERAQEANCTQLKREPQASMGVTPRFQQSTVAIIEMEVEDELFWRWLSNITSIAASLFCRQELNRHEFSLPFHTSCKIICTDAWTSATIPEQTWI